jgi:hypothetical protein
MKYFKRKLSDRYANYYAVQELEYGIVCLVVKNHMQGYDIVVENKLPDDVIESNEAEWKSSYTWALSYFQYWKP